MIGLTSLWIDGRRKVEAEINPRRAVFVLGKIDEILSWEKMKDQEKDVRFVELGEYLFARNSTGNWKNSLPLIIFWRNDFRNQGARPTTSWPFTRISRASLNPSYVRWAGARLWNW